MFIGPVFTREVTIAPRREWTYILRSVYVGLLLLLIVTAWLVISGMQIITDPGDFARFGTMLFQFLAPVQLVLAIFFAATLAASAVGQEKERGTLTLLLTTRMTNRELVLGKLLASLLNIITMLAVSIPVFMAVAMLGGVSYYQIVRVLLVTLFAMLLCGSLGSCVALWRDKTFQAIATTILLMVLWIGLWEGIPALRPFAAIFSPWSAILAASRPAIDLSSGLFGPIQSFLLVCGLLVIGINAVAIALVRVWNPSREARTTTVEVDTWHKKEQTLEESLTFDSVSWENEVGCRPPGGNVGDSRPEPGDGLAIPSAEYRTQPPSGRLPTFTETQKPTRLPLKYFILPLCLSVLAPLVLLFLIVWLPIGVFIARIDPDSYQRIVGEVPVPELWWWLVNIVDGIVHTIGFVGMLYRRKWALWLTAILAIVFVVWSGYEISTWNDPIALLREYHEDALEWCGNLMYYPLLAASCFFALWQCSRYEKKVGSRQEHSPPMEGWRFAQQNDGEVLDVNTTTPPLRGTPPKEGNCSAEYRTQPPGGRLPTTRIRHAWNNPIIWREIMTRAYGRRIWIIQFGFLAFFAMCFWSLHTLLSEYMVITAAQLAGPLVPLFLLSLVLVNAQAITSQTSEKDGGTFDLILASDITPKEYVFGKLGGVFYNMKWIVLFPLALCGYLYWYEALTGTGFFFLTISLIVLYAFVAMVGVYIGMQYENTRAATATSLGLIFFLFVGIAACIWIMVAFSGSFETQLVPFSAFMIGGGIGLYLTLGARNPSSAIATASFSLPIAVFYIITSMLLGKYLLVFVALCGAFGFTTAAMLIPSVAEFDVATGRTTAD